MVLVAGCVGCQVGCTAIGRLVQRQGKDLGVPCFWIAVRGLNAGEKVGRDVRVKGFGGAAAAGPFLAIRDSRTPRLACFPPRAFNLFFTGFLAAIGHVFIRVTPEFCSCKYDGMQTFPSLHPKLPFLLQPRILTLDRAEDLAGRHMAHWESPAEVVEEAVRADFFAVLSEEHMRGGRSALQYFRAPGNVLAGDDAPSGVGDVLDLEEGGGGRTHVIVEVVVFGKRFGLTTEVAGTARRLLGRALLA